MIGNMISKLIFAAFAGGALAIFYTVLLNTHGFTKIKYKHVAISFVALLFCLNLYDFQAAGAACFILAIGIFVLAIALFARGMADNLKDASKKISNAKKETKQEDQTIQKPTEIANYYGAVFHFVIIILICLSIFTTSKDVILKQEHLDRLVGDAFFQFYSTIMLMLLGVFNPFVSTSEKLLNVVKSIDQQKYPKWHKLFSNKRTWTLIKALICVGIISYFVNDGLFKYFTWDSKTPYMNGYVLLIGIFIIVNLTQLIRNPDLFFKRNLFRIGLLFKSAYLGIFAAAILVFSTLFISAILKIDADKLNVSSEAILFLGFNIIMCYNEYRLAERH